MSIIKIKCFNFKAVEVEGGFDSVCKNQRWSHLARQLNYKEIQSARIIKNHYENLLYPYLMFETGESQSISPKKQPPPVVEEITEETADESKKRSSSRKRKPTAKSLTGVENISCLVCKRGDDEAFMLLCDGCDTASYHTFCLHPPLKEVPKGDWRCPDCVADICKRPTDAYGFEQSPRSYTLAEFGRMADTFKADYFKKPLAQISTDECEAEFWRVLAAPDERVAVEYGADLHTIETGSGFPTRSVKGRVRANADPYVDSPWNLNNLSQLDKSVLSQMNVPISGMKVPWAYVGMCFSCFCWHVEDHWSYSINYLHMGEPKSWYGVSGRDAEHFERVMKSSARELFENSPDLLHHLVTIMDPLFLCGEGVPIYRVCQGPGEFVITFPRAYHAGFNQGFNFAEAVNFCPADWIPAGRAAVESYKSVRRHTVFSHDELVCKVASSAAAAAAGLDQRRLTVDINTVVTVQRELRTVIEFERAYRKRLLDAGVKHGNKLAFELLSDDERTCDYCKTTCFVSAVKCTCRPDKMACLDHMEHLCSGSKSSSSSAHHKFTILYR
jgi:histone demethylase JARID1